MVLVDTSVWVSHFRKTESQLVELLERGRVLCHPFIVGELACGNLTNRKLILSLLQDLPMAVMVEHPEVLAFIEAQSIMGKGLGYVDVHILASSRITGVPVWTLDRKLDHVARTLGCSYQKGSVTDPRG